MHWFYESNNETNGPVPEEEIIRLIERGVLKAGNLVWNDSLPDWTRVEQTAFASYLPAKPAFPPTSPRSAGPGASYGASFDESKWSAPADSSFHPRTPVRSGLAFTLLSLFTCGIYYFYLIYIWADETNTHLRKNATTPVLMLLLSIFTCGLATPFIIGYYGMKINEAIEKRGSAGHIAPVSIPLIIGLYVGVIVITVVSQFIVGMGSADLDEMGALAGLSALISFAATGLSIYAFWQVQAGLNRLSTEG